METKVALDPRICYDLRCRQYSTIGASKSGGSAHCSAAKKDFDIGDPIPEECPNKAVILLLSERTDKDKGSYYL